MVAIQAGLTPLLPVTRGGRASLALLGVSGNYAEAYMRAGSRIRLALAPKTPSAAGPGVQRAVERPLAVRGSPARSLVRRQLHALEMRHYGIHISSDHSPTCVEPERKLVGASDAERKPQRR